MQSIALYCEDKPVGGLKSLHFAMLSDIKSLAVTNGTVTVSKAKLKELVFNTKDGATNFTEVTTSQGNGSQSTVPTVTVQFNGINATTRDQLDKLSNPLVKLCLVGQTADGKYWLLGRKYGMVATEVTASTGANNADFNGYNVTFTGEEDELAIPCTLGV